MHKRINCYGNFGFLTKNLVYLVCFATGSFALSQNVLAYYSGVAAQWNDYKYSLHCLLVFNIRKFCQENNCSLRSFLSFKPRQPQLLINQFIIKKSVLYATYYMQYAIKRLLNIRKRTKKRTKSFCLSVLCIKIKFTMGLLQQSIH